MNLSKEYWKMKEEAIDRTVWRTFFGIDCVPGIRQNYVVIIVVSTTEVMLSAIR